VIATALDHDSLVAITVFTLADHFTVAIAIAMTGTNGHTDASGTDTHANVLRTGRHRNGNTSHRDGSHYKSLDHRMFLSMNLSEGQLALM